MWKKAGKFLLILIPGAIAGIVFFLSRSASGTMETIDFQDENKAVSFPAEENPESGPYAESPGPPGEEGVYVYVCGSVKEPGVYYLPESARIFEAVLAAGGMTPDAREESLNLALPVEDGQMIYVPSTAEENTFFARNEGTFQQDERININTASLQELKTLPGIGDVKAANIIAYRNRQPFETIEDIMNVDGIKESSFERIKELIKV